MFGGAFGIAAGAETRSDGVHRFLLLKHDDTHAPFSLTVHGIAWLNLCHCVVKEGLNKELAAGCLVTSALGQSEKTRHLHSAAGLLSTAEMSADGQHRRAVLAGDSTTAGRAIAY